MNVSHQEAVQQQLVAALVERTGYVPELFAPHVGLVEDLGLTPSEVQDAVSSVERKLQVPVGARVDGTTVALLAKGLSKHLDKGTTVERDVEVSLEQVLAFVDDCAARSDRPVLETVLVETRGALARLDAASARPALAIAEPVKQAGGVDGEAVMKLLVGALVERTGYPAEMLEAELDLEADLGIDTVKQVEAFAMARVYLNVEKDENFRLRDHNTLRKMVEYLTSRAPAAAAPAPQAPVAAVAPASSAPSADAILQLLRDAMAAKTGYSLDILQPQLDLEVDLGIDTITQVEVFAHARMTYGVERDDKFRVRHYNTLQKMAEYLAGRAAAVAGPVPAKTTPVATSASVVVPPAPVGEAAKASPDSSRSSVASTVTASALEGGALKASSDTSRVPAASTGAASAPVGEAAKASPDASRSPAASVSGAPRAAWGESVGSSPPVQAARSSTEDVKPSAFVTEAARAPVVAASASAVSQPVASPAPKASTVDADSVMKLLVGALVERTGYPAEMLEAELDLEADLGIDTVKQVEAFAMARVYLNVEKDENFRLRDHNTLRKMVEYLTSRAPAAAAPAPQAPVATAAPTPGLTVQEVQSFLVSVLQGKTGYNIELIQPDLDLEVDLGVDTVTQIEAFAMAREKFGVARNEKFRVRNYNTVRKMSEYLVANAVVAPALAEAAPAAKQGTLGLDDVRRFIARCEASGDTASLRRLAEHLEGRLKSASQSVSPPAQLAGKRYEVHPVELAPQVDAPSVAHLKGKTLGISTDAHGAYKALAQMLEAAGARVVILSSGPAPEQGVSLDWRHPESAGRALKELQEKQPLDGLILLHTTAPTAKLDEQEASAWASTVNTFSLGLYQSALAVYDRIGALPGGGWYLVATAGGGLFGHANAQGRIPLAGAAGGFVKCLRRELPGSRCKVVDLDGQDALQWARQVWNELVSADLDVEVGYTGGRRYVFRDIETSFPKESAPVSLRPGSVVVVSGGGRGVVYPCAKLLAKSTGARVIITGRTVPPSGSEEWLKVPEAELPAYRMSFIKRYLAEHPGKTPVQARRVFDSDIANRRELHRNLEDCRSQGISLEYKVCDMTDVGAVRALLADVRREHGRIDGIVHGATIEESKSLPMKSSDAFVRTLASKAHLWQVLAQETWNDDLQFFINFGSGSGRYGNKGQTDYSLANYLVAKAGLVYSTLRPGVRSVTVDWPVWVGAGIVENNADYLERLRAMGICVIHVDEGAYWFVGELLYGGSAGEVVIADERTFETLNLPRHDKEALRVVGKEAGGTRYAI
ncbi:KR domain-containing protein [Myxococcus sp. AS-1-15]|uniref:KR domain-containing protein n=1 Tax=Myxococcus sp. AS-1-15 TaxID=2874600 RepID=UPI001CBB5708|nr:KR domain-containing protein [Myxococcus sp. AS-1-15]MBZ4401133.1 KR domain-containing protein [Myxococcus sp. AS-1-15]